jgi:serine/threonine protein kinase
LSDLDHAPSLDDAEDSLAILTPYVERFIDAWESAKQPPLLADFLPETGKYRRLALIELIKVDLEFRWRQHNLPKRIADYLAEFPELADGGVSADLIYEEFHICKQSGFTIDPQEYFDQFPAQADELRCLLGLDEPYAPTAIFGEGGLSRLDELVVGERIDDFDLLAFLGKGAFAQVFLARQQSMQRLVALKISADKGTEPQTLAQLDHDYIVRVFDLRVLSDRQLRLLYMQYVAGGTLQAAVQELQQTPHSERTGQVLLQAVDRALESRGEMRPTDSNLREKLRKFSWPETVCWIGARLALGLGYAHQRGILHRDVKPANVLLTAEGVPKLADFNTSFSSKLTGATPAAYFGGSLAYMSPEQLEACDPAHERRPDSLDGRSDLYSLGVMLWELLTGERPFVDEKVEGGWSATLGKMVARRKAGIGEEAVSKLPDDCPPGLVRTLQICLSANIEDRWKTGDVLSRQLELCRKPRVQKLLFPTARSWSTRLLPLAIPLMILAAGIPNGLAGAFNYFHNVEEIISRISEEVISKFMAIMAVINSIAYPLGLGLLAYLTGSIVRVIRDLRKSKEVDAGRLNQLRQRCLKLGHYAAIIGVCEWAVAGIAYPASLHLAAEFTPPHGYVHFYLHFFGSLVLCGLIAASYPFFAATYISIHVLYPRMLQNELSAEHDLPTLQQLKRLSWRYLVSAALVPLLAVACVVLGIDEGSGRVSLIVLSIVGALGFVELYRWFRPLHDDLDALIDAMSPD